MAKKKDPLAIPAFLKRKGKRLTNEEARKLAEETSGRTRTWAPFKDYNSPEYKAAAAEARKPVFFVTNEDAPVTVSVKDKEVRTLARYANIADFKAQHDYVTYPFNRAISTKDETIVVVTAKPWAGKVSGIKTAPTKPREGKRTKLDIVRELLLRPEGCTRQEILDATGWPTVSVPANAATLKLSLTKEKKPGEVMRYWGRVGK